MKPNSTPPEPSSNTSRNAAEIAVILDRSGSMRAIADDAIGGFNAFLDSQRRQPGEARMSLVLFNDGYEVPLHSVPLAEVPLLTSETFVPRGSTALLDAIGRTIHAMADSLTAQPAAARPDTIIVAILTDGMENASQSFSLAQISDLIAEKRAEGWEFIFLAANQDAIASARRLSIPDADARPFATTPEGARSSFRDLDELMRLKRRKL